jgi:hypothetical protein
VFRRGAGMKSDDGNAACQRVLGHLSALNDEALAGLVREYFGLFEDPTPAFRNCLMVWAVLMECLMVGVWLRQVRSVFGLWAMGLLGWILYPVSIWFLMMNQGCCRRRRIRRLEALYRPSPGNPVAHLAVPPAHLGDQGGGGGGPCPGGGVPGR